MTTSIASIIGEVYENRGEKVKNQEVINIEELGEKKEESEYERWIRGINEQLAVKQEGLVKGEESLYIRDSVEKRGIQTLLDLVDKTDKTEELQKDKVGLETGSKGIGKGIFKEQQRVELQGKPKPKTLLGIKDIEDKEEQENLLMDISGYIMEEIKKRDKLFSRLVGARIGRLTQRETRMYLDSLENLMVAVNRTNMPHERVLRMSGLSEEQYQYVMKNEFDIKAQLNVQLGEGADTQKHSSVFNTITVQKEVKENDKLMFNLYLQGVTGENLFEMCRIFYIESVWRKLSIEYKKRKVNYKKSMAWKTSPTYNEANKLQVGLTGIKDGSGRPSKEERINNFLGL